jgi:hypothetical protein
MSRSNNSGSTNDGLDDVMVGMDSAVAKHPEIPYKDPGTNLSYANSWSIRSPALQLFSLTMQPQ